MDEGVFGKEKKGARDIGIVSQRVKENFLFSSLSSRSKHDILTFKGIICVHHFQPESSWNLTQIQPIYKSWPWVIPHIVVILKFQVCLPTEDGKLLIADKQGDDQGKNISYKLTFDFGW